ncbi:proteasome activator complex subunit 4-like, partial [Tropilaelaps mercedesae]
VLKWQASHCAQAYTCVLPLEAILLIPAVCRLIADTSNEELQKDCGILVALLGYELLSNQTLHLVVEVVQTCLNDPFWRVRTFIVSLLLFVTYSNLFMVWADAKLMQDIKDIFFNVIADERVEVRMAAQGALSGLIHCGLIDITDEMLTRTKGDLRKIARKLRARREQRRAILEARHTKSNKNAEKPNGYGSRSAIG